MKPWKIIAGIGVLIAVGAIVGLLAYFSTPEVQVVAPTCTAKGYTIYTQNGKTQFRDIVDATGHSFTEWQTVQSADGFEGGKRTRTCIVCGETEEEVFYEERTLPQIHLTGDTTTIGKKEQVLMEARFSMEGVDFDGYALIKYQGHSTLKYLKKNYTMKLYADEQCDEKQELRFSHWNAENKYILKANFNDVSRSRNLICADIWSTMVASRDEVHPRLQETSNMGAVDGFPVELYLNDSYQGIYNVTLHKDDDLFCMEDGRKDGIMIINEAATQDAFFKESVDWQTTTAWEVEYCGTEDQTWLKEKTDAFIAFVQNSTDKEFSENIGAYVDLDSLIDYMLAFYALGLPDNAAKDLLLATYDDGPFIASLFDMEDAFGLRHDGSGFYEVDYGLPVMRDGVWDSGTGSLLWDRVLQNFYPQICGRYKELSSGILSVQGICAVVEEKLGAIPKDVNEAEFSLYPEQPLQDVDHLQQIKDFVTSRASALDQIFTEGQNDEK